MSPPSPVCVCGGLVLTVPVMLLSGNLIFVVLHFALEAWRDDVWPSLARPSGCMGRNVAWGWQAGRAAIPAGRKETVVLSMQMALEP